MGGSWAWWWLGPCLGADGAPPASAPRGEPAARSARAKAQLAASGADGAVAVTVSPVRLNPPPPPPIRRAPSGALGSMTAWRILADAVGADAGGAGGADDDDAAPPIDEEDEEEGGSGADEDADARRRASGGAAGPSDSNSTCRAEEFEVVRELGRGAFGRALAARRRADGADVCVKVLDLGGAGRRARRLAAEEVAVLSKLRHPNVVEYIGTFFTADGSTALVMELCAGGDLERWARRRRRAGQPPTERGAMRRFVQLALALEFCHSQGVVHRDVKVRVGGWCGEGLKRQIIHYCRHHLNLTRALAHSRRSPPPPALELPPRRARRPQAWRLRRRQGARARHDLRPDDRRDALLHGARGGRGSPRGPPRRRLGGGVRPLRARRRAARLCRRLGLRDRG
jgi:hypothetical protein